MRNAFVVRFLIIAVLVAAPVHAGRDIKVRVTGGMLHGTLEVPSKEAACPAALIIAGSGPTDRDGNSPLAAGRNNSLKLLAEGLASRGIASVRYDKRGVGQSASTMTKEEDLRFETYIDDAVMWAKELRKNKRFTDLMIIGHSDGALIGSAACRKVNIDAFVSIAGAGFPASQLLLSQLKPKMPEALFEKAQTIIHQLNHGKTTDSVPPNLNLFFRKSVQPYLISWFRYDPAEEIAKLKIPILIVQGSTDIQVNSANADALATSNKLAKQITIEGMNHVLKKVSADISEQISSYGDPSLPIAEELVKGIATFMLSVKTTI